MEEKLRRKFTTATDMEIQAASRLMEAINRMDFARALLPIIADPALRASVLDAMNELTDRLVDTIAEAEARIDQPQKGARNAEPESLAERTEVAEVGVQP